MNLEPLLRRLPALYDDLGLALVPTSRHPLAGGDEGGTGGTRVEAPAPANLDVIEHRHKLVKGLRWWLVDRAPVRFQQSVAAMCAWLIAHPSVLTGGEWDELAEGLRAWEATAAGLLGPLEGETRDLDLPPGAGEQVVRVADAARLLGCTVRTIQRRVPAEHRPDGRMKLWRAMPDCPRCDLKVGAGCACA